MRPLKAAGLILLVPFCLLVAEEFAEFKNGMKATDTANGALRKLDKKVGPEAAAAAERIAAVYEEMIPFWRGRNSPEAVRWAEEGKAHALLLASAASSGDEAKAAAAFSSLGGTCKSCHSKHRERLEDGSYRIK
jgi:cytochrome c556